MHDDRPIEEMPLDHSTLKAIRILARSTQVDEDASWPMAFYFLGDPPAQKYSFVGAALGADEHNPDFNALPDLEADLIVFSNGKGRQCFCERREVEVPESEAV